MEPAHKSAKTIWINRSAAPRKKLTDFSLKQLQWWERKLGWNHWERQTTIQNHRITITETHQKITQSPAEDNQCRMVKMVIESFRQSVIGSISLWVESAPRGSQREKERRFHRLVIGLQGVINRPELKQHLTLHTLALYERCVTLGCFQDGKLY